MDEFVELSDGRRLGYRVTGSPNGTPVIFFHGLGQSRLTMHPDTSIVAGLGIRLITIDRPGVGLSSPRPGRTLLDWPHDVATLADHLNLAKFAVIGHSAGTPYVLVCAHAFPERIISVAIVSGIPPASLSLLRVLFASRFWKLGVLLFLLPLFARPVIWMGIQRTKPRAMTLYERRLPALPAIDRMAMADPAMKEMRVRSMLESFRQGAEGLHEDVSVLRKPWGFDLSSIQLPVSIWHGEADDIVHVFFGRELASRLPNKTFEICPGVGHNMLFSYWTEIFSAVAVASITDAGR